MRRIEMVRLFRQLTIALSVVALAGIAHAQTPAQPPTTPALATREGDFTVRDFKFASGETLPELRLHYTTLGSPKRDAKGHVANAVLILHGTGGDGHQFLRPQF